MSTCSRHQRTLAESVEVSGFGYWSGENATLRFQPAPADTGVVFVLQQPGRSPARIPAVLSQRIDAQRRTVLAGDGRRVAMVEHVLAALAGMQIDNCEVWCDAEEMPGCDGSSLAFSEALLRGGVVVQVARRRRLMVDKTIRVGDQWHWVEARPSDSGALSVRYELDYGPGPIGAQQFAVELTTESFQRELAPARTFVLQHEAQAMRQAGLGLRVSQTDLLIFDQQGPMGNSLRFDNECRASQSPGCCRRSRLGWL